MLASGVDGESASGCRYRCAQDLPCMRPCKLKLAEFKGTIGEALVHAEITKSSKRELRHVGTTPRRADRLGVYAGPARLLRRRRREIGGDRSFRRARGLRRRPGG